MMVSLMLAPTLPDLAAADGIASMYITRPTPVTEPSRDATAEPHAKSEEPTPHPVAPLGTETEKFLLTTADQESSSRDEWLNHVVRSKYEAGLLKLYDYVRGYTYLSQRMDASELSVCSAGRTPSYEP